jgi:hypothetical protein
MNSRRRVNSIVGLLLQENQMQNDAVQEDVVSDKSTPPSGLRLEALKLLRDWSVWLLTIEAAICTALWKTGALTGKWSFAGWSAFCLSAMAASVLLIVVPDVAQNNSDGVDNHMVRRLARAECGLFLIGISCLIIGALWRWHGTGISRLFALKWLHSLL